MTPIPASRIRVLADRPAQPGRYVLYWMTAARRPSWNFALDHALALAERMGGGLVVLEALRAAYPWASARFHQFVVEGMAANARAFDVPGVTYYPYLERTAGDGAGLVETLAAGASVVVCDDYPAFFLRDMLEKVAPRLQARVEAVDANGLVPMRAAGTLFPTAYAFRRHLQRVLASHLAERPAEAPLADARLPRTRPALPEGVATRWPAWRFGADGDAVATLAIDQSVGAVADLPGGHDAAVRRLETFVRTQLGRYGERNHPDDAVTSGLSPYLHFGHVASWEIFDAVMRHEGWLGVVPTRGRGERAGWWGVSAAAEGFLDQLVTWRELGFNACVGDPSYDQWDSLPAWARTTLTRHAKDPREVVYTRDAFAAAETHDAIWNAAQRQLVREGQLHNYLRMLWGKKILEWSPTPESALDTMIDLNNRYALDGRDPNSYSGILWTLGRYDRPWGPERPILGTIRYMSSDNTAKKLHLREYLARYGAPGEVPRTAPAKTGRAEAPPGQRGFPDW